MVYRSSLSSSFLNILIMLSIMRTTAVLALTGLLSQVVDASPTWQPPKYDAEKNKLGGVASESSICSNIGIDMLKCGGNAADSLVATVLCVGVDGMYHRYD